MCRYNDQYTSPRRASMTHAITSSVSPIAVAKISRLVAPMIGTSSTWAIAFADAIPTRIPVNKPGPMSTATAPTSPNETPACLRTKSIIVVNTSACCFSLRISLDANTRVPSAIATLTPSVAVSIDKMIMKLPKCPTKSAVCPTVFPIACHASQYQSGVEKPNPLCRHFR